MSEADEQMAVVEWLDRKGYDMAFHIPNGGFRLKSEAAKMKAMGVRPGVPDLFLPYPRGRYHGLFIEMKDVDGRKPTKAQREWLELLDAKGYQTAWAKGADMAIKMIERYLAL